ncbi:Rieske (2Fe-2S) protein [Nocardioides agariphilus]|jgi:Rieske Fe-S protein|uniref:Cytochrome bc1 complex Rieske iron-sulfur subunit n=1 Tax=Nocardioides agariphilus TaxID=433664 RepID=A0A930YI79_9ACTN|nr:Rieske (2Fe-2S) protein [Nocardioides agariphilus]MBF4767907.1 Rieske (2Fe-2S) protein [Nocardioides agariphilus]
MTAPDHHPLLRRRTLAGAVTAGLALPALAACSGDGGTQVATDPNTPGGSTSRTPGGNTDAFAQTSDIEVGGGTIYPDAQVVITQPTEGDFKCFTAVCTHQGCIVSSVSDGSIHCDCHGSAFSIKDGSVVNGPATQPLAAEDFSVDGDAITLG